MLVIARTFIRLHVSRRISSDDVCIYFALSSLISMAILYTLVTPTMFELDRISTGQEAPPLDLIPRADFYLRCQFAIICLFWTTLWAVKISIMMFYKGLFHGLPLQMRLWQVVMGFVILFYFGCWGTQLASCRPMAGYFHLGMDHLTFTADPTRSTIDLFRLV